MDITLDRLHDLARGAAFLGTGGGGDPYIGRLMLQQQLSGGGRVRLIDPSELDDDALVVPVANMGAVQASGASAAAACQLEKQTAEPLLLARAAAAATAL